MAKKQQKKADLEVKKPESNTINVIPSVKQSKFSILNIRTQAIILIIICFVFYCNTISHEYAFDDMMAIVDNDYVQQGFAGIPKIMTSDAFQSYIEHKNGSNQLSGGRYRPLSLITFAVEQQFLGINNNENNSTENSIKGPNKVSEKEEKLLRDMHVRHFVNILIYLLTAVVLLYFLSIVVFPANPLIAFISVLLFTIHPIHTEVVANVKSRDEILSILFISLTFIQFFKYAETKKMINLYWSMVCFFLALLSKEYAITLIILLPLSLYLFLKDSISASLKKCLLFLIPLVLYALLRFSSVNAPGDGAENNVMNNPYLYATGIEKIASQILVLLNYIKLLFIPHPLISDYSYNQIPYTNFANPLVWLSIVVHVGLIFIMGVLLKKRHELSFALAFYFLNLSLINNFAFNIGTTMGERLIFHSSLGFCIVVAYLLVTGKNYIKPANVAYSLFAVLIVVIIMVSGFKTIERNKDWKNNETLFLHDVKLAPNSVLINNDAAASCMNLAKHAADSTNRNIWFGKAIQYFTKTISLNPLFTLAYLNRGLCYFNSGLPDKALSDWDTVRIQNPKLQNLTKYLSIASKYYMGHAIKHIKENNEEAAIAEFNKAIDATPNNPEMWYNIAITYLKLNKTKEAKYALEKTLQLMPNNKEVKQLLSDILK